MSNSTWPSGRPGMIWLSALISSESDSCASVMNGKTAHEKTDRAMAENFIIGRRQLNRTPSGCQERFHRQDGSSASFNQENKKAGKEFSLMPVLLVRRLASFLRQKRERHRREDAQERGDMVPADVFVQIEDREAAEHHDGDGLLHDLELRGGINRVAPAVRRHHEEIFKERDAPAHQNGQPQRRGFVFQMAI